MKIKLFIFLIFSYLIAFATNLIPSLKHPDSNLSIINFLFSVLFIIVLLIYTKNASYSNKVVKGLKIFLIIGLVSGFIVYIIKMFEDTLTNHFLLDMVASIQYPFYLVFTTPLFGINYLFDLNYGIFSLLMSTLYLIAFVLVMSFKKYDIQNT